MPVARRDVVGLPAYAQATGAAVGRVAEVLCGKDVAHVIGLLLEGRGRRRSVVPFEEVAAIGGSAVLLKNPVVLAAGEGPRLREVRRRTATVVGRRVLAADGHEVGVIDDLVFDGSSGRVLGFLVSGGLIHDLLQGQGFLPAAAAASWRAQAVVLEPDVAARVGAAGLPDGAGEQAAVRVAVADGVRAGADDPSHEQVATRAGAHVPAGGGGPTDGRVATRAEAHVPAGGGGPSEALVAAPAVAGVPAAGSGRLDGDREASALVPVPGPLPQGRVP